MNAALPRTASGIEQVLLADPRHIGLATVVQIADLEGLTGWIEVVPHGRILLRDGAIVGATCGRFTGLDAWFELFLREDGDELAVARGEHDGPSEALGSVMQLILEAARRSDEWARVAHGVASPLEPHGQDGARAVQLIGSIDGTRTVAEAAVHAGLPNHAAAALVQSLLEGGRTRLTVPSRPRPQPTPNRVDEGQLDAWLLQGREACRQGDLRGALDLLERVVRARPDDRVAAQNLRHVHRLIRERGP